MRSVADGGGLDGQLAAETLRRVLLEQYALD